MSTTLRVRLLAHLSAALLAALPGAASAQATITGQVLDATSNTPIADAVVAIVELRRAVKTDSTGSFTIAGARPGMYRWSVIRHGYVPLDQQMDIRDGDHFRVGVMRIPAPVGVVALTPNRTAEIFRRRVNAALTPVRLLTQDVLLEGEAPSAERAVAARAELRPCPATLAEANSGTDCVMARGRVQPVSVYIDELPALGGLFQLAAFEPRELYAVELWNGGAEIRVFTNRFVEALTEGRAQFAPRG